MRLREAWRRLRDLGRSRQLERDLRDEMETHLSLLAEDYRRRGSSPDEARTAARRDFGGLDQAKESVRDRRGIPMLEHLWRDVRHAVRVLRKAPAFTSVAVMTLALGIGVNTAIFSVLDAVILRPLPFADPGRLVSLYEAQVGRTVNTSQATARFVFGASDPGRMVVAPANFVDYQAQVKGLTAMATFDTVSLTLTGVGFPEQLTAEEVTSNYFDVLGRSPALGRLPYVTEGKVGAAPVAVLSDPFWRSRFGADPSIVGRTILLNDQSTRVVGVMPAGFQAVSELGRSPAACALWVVVIYPPDLLASHGDHETNVVARLAPGVSLVDAQRSLTAVSEGLSAAYPEDKAVRAFLRPLHDDLIETVRPSLVALIVMVGLVLLIACVNVANLFIVRAAGHRRDVAVRYALGASPGRVTFELLTQCLLLSGAGALGGLAFGYWTKGSLVALAPSSVPRLGAIGLNGAVIGYATGLALLTGVAFGLLPVWQARRARPLDALKSATGAERAGSAIWTMRWRNALMVVEIALSTLLVVGASLAARSLFALNHVDVGFRTDHVLALNIVLPDQRYLTGDARYAFFSMLETRLAAIPGVSQVGFANRLPLRGGWSSGIQIDGVDLPNGIGVVDYQAVSPGYFDVLGLRLLRGRFLRATDTKTSEPVTVVSEQFSTEFLSGRDPVGMRIRRGPTAPWITIVGVVADVRRNGQRAEVTSQGYLPAAQTTLYPVHLSDVALLVTGDAASYRAAIQNAVWSIDRNQPITNVRTLDETLAIAAKDQRFQTSLFALFAALAVVLALVGVHGVVSYSVAQRTSEIGVRMALGADGRWVLLWVLRQAAVLVLLGAALGTLGAAGLSRFLASLLFHIQPTDALTYGVAVSALGSVAMAACLVAARRATIIDPVQALRQE